MWWSKTCRNSGSISRGMAPPEPASTPSVAAISLLDDTPAGPLRTQPEAISARLSLRRASPRSVPVLRTVRFQPPTRFQGSPSRRASPLPITRRRRFQSMKTAGSAEAALPSLRPLGHVPSASTSFSVLSDSSRHSVLPEVTLPRSNIAAAEGESNVKSRANRSPSPVETSTF